MGEIIRLTNINKSFLKSFGFGRKDKLFHVIKNLNLTINSGEILAIVGESGCGKTTLGRIITGLLKPDKGEMIYEDRNVYSGLNIGRSFENYRNNVQFVQQDSYSALNPVRTIYQSLSAPIKNRNRKITNTELNAKIIELLEMVELMPAELILNKYPHQLSGGQRQRILMARALSLNPKLIVADEPVSMIDVSLRISILDLLTRLNTEFNISVVYITHDLATARYIANNGRLAVMYLGEFMEIGKINDILLNPRHPYSQALISAVPIPDPDLYLKDTSIPIKSMELESLEDRSDGCSFYSRCLYASDTCLNNHCDLQNIDGVEVRCHNIKDVPSWEW
jgi:peptide/nickel transport system ATP-binding protein